MANIIVAIHQGFLEPADCDRIQATLEENGVTIENLRQALSKTQKPLNTIREEIESGNHLYEDDLRDYELDDLIEDYALLLTPDGIACISNSFDCTCALKNFYNYHFLFFPDKNDNQKLVFTEIEDETDVMSLSMKEIFEWFYVARTDENPFAIFDNCRCEVV